MVRRTEDAQADPAGDLADDFLKDGWARTVADMRAMAEDRAGKGFDTYTLAADDTAGIAPSMGDDDRIGFSHLIPGDEADEIEPVFEGFSLDETGVYQSTDSGHVFMVTELVDYDDETVIYVAGTFRMADAAALVRAAVDMGHLHTYVRRLNRENVGTVRHEDVDAFFPNPGIYESYEPDNPF